MREGMNQTKVIGVIGAGSFGMAIANLLAHHNDVLLFSRHEAVVEEINKSRKNKGVTLANRVQATHSMEEIVGSCKLLFPIIPSTAFRKTIISMSPFLTPSHTIIHGTKGFDLINVSEEQLQEEKVTITRRNVRTMSEVVLEESHVLRVGCLSGPNLASEILAGQPTATLVASRFKEVIQQGQNALNSPVFHVFGSYDLIGAELAGALKNIIALASGMLEGLGMGRNMQGLLISRGLAEMVYFGKEMGAQSKAFVGVAGIGDLVTTATSPNSRNHTFGQRLAKGETVEQIRATMPELAEGVRTLKIAHELAKHYRLRVPIVQTLYAVIYEGLDMQRALKFLMSYPYDVDVDFL
jgi:glycerol-3-phosphate dehydrogenase (NAD(P)+)